jgi:Spy/CpxP family protein refolding chaperone
MKHKMSPKRVLALAAMALFFGTPFTLDRTVAQQPDQPNDAAQRPVADDLIRELNLTPEQREQIRGIRQQNQEERMLINRRLREANQTLQEALDLDNPDEVVIEQLVRQVATLQGAQMRMRVLSEVRIRRVLTPEQRSLLRNLRLSRQLRRNPLQNPRREGLRRNRRNALRPIGPTTRP